MKIRRMARPAALVRLAALIACLGAFAAPVAASGDPTAGARVFNQCKACHQVGERARNRVGPVLNGVVGAAAGHVDGFRYSRALAESGLTWDEETLAAYLADPRGFIPGNRMVFRGLRSEEQIADVIAYLATYGPEGKPR